MNAVRYTCPGCRKEVEDPRPEVAKARVGKKDDPLVILRATCPECGKVVQLSRLK